MQYTVYSDCVNNFMYCFYAVGTLCLMDIDVQTVSQKAMLP